MSGILRELPRSSVKRHGGVSGKGGKAKRRIFQEMRASEAKEEQTFSGGRRKGSAREGSRTRTAVKGRRDEKGERERKTTVRR